MTKALRITVFSLAGLLAVGGIGVGVLIATFDPNDYKPLLIRLVQEKKQRTLSIPGDIKMTFYPSIGADLGEVSLSAHGSQEEFAAVRSARVSLALLPLLSRQLVVDKIRIDGLRAHLVRHKDGSTNYDDLLSEEESEDEISFDIAGVHVTDARIRYEDRQQQRALQLDRLDLETGRIAQQAASSVKLSAQVQADKPQLDAAFTLDSALDYDLKHRHFVFRDAVASLKGRVLQLQDVALQASAGIDLKPANQRFVLTQVALEGKGRQQERAFSFKLNTPGLVMTDTLVNGGKLEASGQLKEGGRTLQGELVLPKFEGTPSAFSLASLTLDASLREADLDAKARLSGALKGDLEKMLFTSPGLQLALSGQQGGRSIGGSLGSPVAANLQAQRIELPSIAADLTLPNPGGGTLVLKGDGRASADLAGQTVAAQLKGRLDDSAFDARVGLSQLSPMSYTFDIGLDQLDLDRYRAVTTDSAGKPPAAGKPASGGAQEQAIDLSALRDLRAKGSLRVGRLSAGRLKASDVALEVQAADGRLNLPAMSARLYGGSLKGTLSAAAGTPQRFALQQQASNIDAGALLQAALDKHSLEGRGDVRLDLTASGASVDQLIRSLGGNASLQLRDGAVRGINIAQSVRTAKARLNALQGKAAVQDGTGTMAEKTDFTELSASFRIQDGIARNDDLQAKSPLLRMGGAGTLDLPAEELDYLVKATVAPTLQGQGGPELESLKGLTIPVRLSGPFSAIKWKVDLAGMAEGAVKDKLDEKKEELRDKAKDKLRQELKGLFGG